MLQELFISVQTKTDRSKNITNSFQKKLINFKETRSELKRNGFESIHFNILSALKFHVICAVSLITVSLHL